MRKTPHLSALTLFLVFLLFGCSPSPRYTSGNSLPSTKKKGPPKTSSREIPVTKNPKLSYKQTWTGVASWYGEDFHGKLTANGETYDMHDLTAAHKTLPLGTVLRVTNLDNGKSVKVRINDRGPYIEGRMIDLSFAAAKKLGFSHLGTARVKLQVIKFGDNAYKKQK